MKVLLVQMNPTVGDISGNTVKVLAGIEEGRDRGAQLVVFPELALSGYPPDDFLLLPNFIEKVEQQLQKVISASSGIALIVGLPRFNHLQLEKPLSNSAAVIEDGVLLGFQDKSLLPTYDVFDERRYFEPATKTPLFNLAGKRVAITICEDLWQHSQSVPGTYYKRDPVEELRESPPDLLINIAASPFRQLRFQDRLVVCSAPAKTLQCPVLLCNQVGGNDSLIFDGFSLYVGADGELKDFARGFTEDTLLVDLDVSKKTVELTTQPIENLYNALVLGVRDYFHKLGLQKALLGLSGGIDSAVVAGIAVEALGSGNVLGVLMPSRYTSQSSVADAESLAHNLGINTLTIPIEGPFQSYLDLLKPHFKGAAANSTEENLQARTRAMILMALSNKWGHLLLSTGNKSEMAMGYTTLYGDLCGGLSVLSDVTKHQVYALGRWINSSTELIPENIFLKPPSAELRANQKDSDTLPDYSIVDQVVEDYVEKHLPPDEIAEKNHISLPIVEDLIRRIHSNEYKRRQSPPGLRVTSKAFTVGRRFPIVQKWVN